MSSLLLTEEFFSLLERLVSNNQYSCPIRGSSLLRTSINSETIDLSEKGWGYMVVLTWDLGQFLEWSIRNLISGVSHGGDSCGVATQFDRSPF
jgi:hypothetical protein